MDRVDAAIAFVLAQAPHSGDWRAVVNGKPYDKTGFTPSGSGQCFLPNSDNPGDYATAYFSGC